MIGHESKDNMIIMLLHKNTYVYLYTIELFGVSCTCVITKEI
jgi:hypothetical protein